MKKKFLLIACSVSLALLTTAANADIVVTTSAFGSLAGAEAGPAVSATDLGQTAFLSSTGVVSNPANAFATRSDELFNGTIGDVTTGTADVDGIRALTGDTVTLNLDISTNTLGYDITQLDSVFGWNETGGGRSNQGYSVTFGLVGGGTVEINGQHWEPNADGDPNFWTKVSMVNGGGGALNSDTVDLNGAGPIADAGGIATGVSSITWTITNDATPGNIIVAREFDVFGTPTTGASTSCGDVNTDGSIDFLDIGPFIAILSNGGFQVEADCDESGFVDFLDIGPFITALASQ